MRWPRGLTARPAGSAGTETGEPPRPALLDRAGLEREVASLAGATERGGVYVAAFGLDRFDRLRAALGYDAVADLVRRLAERLSENRPEWSLARVSDDVVSAAFRADDEAGARRLAEAARQGAQGAYAVGPYTVDVHLSAGLSVAGPPSALIREADLALDAARGDRSGLRVFDAAAQAAAADALSLMPELRRAIASGQLWLAHQPKYDMRTGRVAGVESLVRWTHPERGPVPPSVFVTLAEETGDIAALTRWVLDRALIEQAELALQGFDLTFAVNLSGRLLGKADFIDWIIERKASMLGRLQLEITETAVIDDPERAFLNVKRLAAAGIGCSIDDYGSGLSSLAYLKRIEARELKLDKSLVDEVTRSARDALVIRSTVDLAHSLGMKVVAEGIEDAATAAVLAGLGCDLGQGFHFSRPVRLGDLLEFVRRQAAFKTEPSPAQPSPGKEEPTQLNLRRLALPSR
jgi:diguanylate cyclase